MGLTEKEKELVAIGSSIGGNCIPCLEYHYEKCKELGFSKEEMQEAFNVAKMVKEVPNNKIYETAEKLNNLGKLDNAEPPSNCCGDSTCC
ncbi:MAG: carboxymuconolactone decarboxylase family protein [Synergistaceae bacterium]|nr:carboxymuconolactone decarboxylase family protein [Synergistaceae bacterium]